MSESIDVPLPGAQTEIINRPERVGDGYLVNPATGGVVTLAGPTDLIVEAIDECKDIEGRLRTFKRALADEILRRMDHEGTWTARLGDFKVSGDGPRGPEYDGQRLVKALDDLVMRGLISKRAADKAVEAVTTYKVKRAGVNALLKLGPDVVAAIESAAEQNLKPRQVRVTREPM